MQNRGVKCPNCNFVQSDGNTECLKCGIIFEKFRRDSEASHGKTKGAPRKGRAAWRGTLLREWIFYIEPETNPFYFGGRVLILLVLFLWGWKFILAPMKANYPGGSFLHLVNLPFHEAGHIFFQPFGHWMTALGGTLGQLLIPAVCLLVLLVKTRDPVGASVSLWWLGESLMDIAPYINDARNQELMLLGEVTGKEADYGYHDWEFILNEIGLLRYDHVLASFAYGVGILLMLTSAAWAGYVLFRQYRNLAIRG